MEEQSTGLQKLLHNVAAYDGDFKKWEARAQKIIKRYRDDNRSQNTNETAKFNILWSNVQTLIPAVYARLPKADVTFDVLEKADAGLAKPNSVCDPRPEMSWVVLAEPLSGCAEWLAGVAAREDVHFSVKSEPRERLNIRPDRCCVQESRFHFSDQVRAGERFDLAKSDCAQMWDCSFKSEINASVAIVSNRYLTSCSNV